MPVRDYSRPPATLLAVTTLTCCLAADAAPLTTVPITIIGTSDIHGRVERAPILAANIDAVRAELQKAGGGVVWVDGGDLFQGTLESNLVEGRSVVEVLNVMKPDAVAIGNHEFDYGPAGPLTIPKTANDDPRGALKQRISEAKFPFLAANIADGETKKPVAWPNTKPSTMVTVAGVKVGVIGVSTIETPHTTTATNFKGLSMIPLREAIAAEADALRKSGAHIVVVGAHVGGACKDVANPPDVSSCDVASAEVFALANALPAGLVDAIVAGHTHNQIAHVVNGIPIIESWANVRGFGRIDLAYDTKARKVSLVKVHAPHAICVDDKGPVCEPAPTASGAPIKPDAKVAALVAPYVEQAKKAKDRRLGVDIVREVKHGYDHEAALDDLFADTMLEAARVAGWKADVAIMNGGGVRANLPAGPLTYGAVYEMMPFDNRFAKIHTTGKVLREWLESNLAPTKKGGLLFVAGVVADIQCEGKSARVTLSRPGPDGKPISDTEPVDIVTTDFLATGGEATKLPPGSIELDEGDPIREHVARALQKRGGSLDGPAMFDESKRRLRSGRCQAP